MCFAVDRKLTTRLRAAPPVYGYKLVLAAGGALCNTETTTIYDPGITRADKGPATIAGDRYIHALHGIYLYPRRPRVDRWYRQNMTYLRCRVKGKVRVAGHMIGGKRARRTVAFTVDAVEVTPAAHRNARARIDKARKFQCTYKTNP